MNFLSSTFITGNTKILRGGRRQKKTEKKVGNLLNEWILKDQRSTKKGLLIISSSISNNDDK